MLKTARAPATKFELSDIVLALGILASIFTVALILAFAQGETAVLLGIAWGWLIEIAIWVYIFAFAI